ncbi:4-deoxy-L-threo-5-hexosulose-uronate ketol-isomerase [Klebsiella grimontii]|uniref:4-deoxy-L-threo-5-hexosulose-uronate ketol-isomerase n=1 Tax=Klebsiella grimontii TaxID=2058152 RepID=A0A7H4P183_9ENTR|nr:4-deoxy-L-threo-5-hexosulose-uronate ketol-isomerase [Klebsiella grimontii]
MKIALDDGKTARRTKNAIILNELNAVADEKGFPVYNVGMSDENDHHLTYIHLGIMASILLNSKSGRFCRDRLRHGPGRADVAEYSPGRGLRLLHRSCGCLPVCADQQR